MKNGRCYRHGGRVPSGKNWHVLQPVKGKRRSAAKLAQVERRQRKRAHKVAKMTADERAAHDAWHASHRPGPAGPRAERRAWKKRNAEARAGLGIGRPAATSPEIEALKIEEARIRAAIEALTIDPELFG